MDISIIKLEDIIQALHMTTDDFYAYFDPSTNQIEWVSQEYFSIADDID